MFTILEAIRKNNPDAELVHVSTDEVYGDIIKGSFKEEDRLKPSSPYSASKAAADMFVLAYVRTYGLHTIGMDLKLWESSQQYWSISLTDYTTTRTQTKLEDFGTILQ